MQPDGSPHDWLEGRGRRLTALGLQDDASGKILAAGFFLSETAAGYYLHSANRLLRCFVADYNCRFARTPRDAAHAWRPAPKNLERICAFRHERIVSNENVVLWEGRCLQNPLEPRRFSFAGAKV